MSRCTLMTTYVKGAAMDEQHVRVASLENGLQGLENSINEKIADAESKGWTLAETTPSLLATPDGFLGGIVLLRFARPKAD